MGTVHTVAVHFRYDHCMRRLANEFLCRNPIVKYRIGCPKMARNEQDCAHQKS